MSVSIGEPFAIRITELHDGMKRRADAQADLLYIPIDGRAFISIGCLSVDLDRYDLCMVPCGEKREVSCKGDLLEIAFIGGNVDARTLESIRTAPHLYCFLIRGMQVRGDTSFIVARYKGDKTAYNDIWRAVKEERRGDAGSQVVAGYLFESALIGIARSYMVYGFAPSPDIHVSDALLSSILGYLRENCANATLRMTAKWFGYHPNSISLMIKRETGKTFSEILREYRMDLARQLLMRTDRPVEVIARECGYQQVGSFYRTFRMRFGMTPGGFRAAS